MRFKYKSIGIIASIFVVPFVFAQGFGTVAQGSFGAAQLISSLFGPFFQALLGGDSYLLFERILLFFILLSSIYMVVNKMDIFNSNKAIVFIVTISVSLLAIRFTKITELVYTVILPYSVLGVAITAFLPLILGFFFIHNASESSFIRKSFWIFFIVVFFVMWDLNYATSGPVSWIYFWSAIISALFFLFDGTIRRAMVRSRMKAAGETTADAYAIKIRRELTQLKSDYTAGHVTDRVYKKIKRRLNNQLEELLKH